MAKPDPDPSIHEAIQAIRELVEAQNMRAAKNQIRNLQSRLDDQTWLMVTEIANTLRFKTQPAAVARLRSLWRTNETHRALIAACVPKPGENQHLPDLVRQRKPHPDEIRPKAGNIIESYEDDLDKSERDDPGTPRPELIVDRRDYDENILDEVRFGLCVSCRLERAAIDRHTDREIAGRGDDGLCGECRSLGRPGIPELPVGHDRSQAIEARLDFLTEHYDTRSPGLFRQEWRHADRDARSVITEWVKDHVEVGAEPPAQRGVVVAESNAECEKCRDRRQLRDGLCVDCHPAFAGRPTPAGSIERRHQADAVVAWLPGEVGASDGDSEPRALRSRIASRNQVQVSMHIQDAVDPVVDEIVGVMTPPVGEASQPSPQRRASRSTRAQAAINGGESRLRRMHPNQRPARGFKM
ncbi:hypothetical protein D5S18_34165 [Nocardia panacis]|uniref:Uncharacterized protein n=1 Tax=Nocardia panacis TaxID=2340916 RepID=A0A3A4K221_9NOCA|nr:hypothetical protein [Nocardia panacis]RJO67948.1 hypothetical protein D5S18_34165 [Nocardia panacis]